MQLRHVKSVYQKKKKKKLRKYTNFCVARNIALRVRSTFDAGPDSFKFRFYLPREFGLVLFIAVHRHRVFRIMVECRLLATGNLTI